MASEKTMHDEKMGPYRGKDGMKKGGKAYKRGGKVHGEKNKMRLDRKATGGGVVNKPTDKTDSGIGPKNPIAKYGSTKND